MVKSKRGFTLVEVLIVIAVIGILASIILVGLGNVRPGARDTRRISDLRSVQGALEVYFNKCGYYPNPTASAQQLASPECQTDVNEYKDLEGALTVAGVAKQIPHDPQWDGQSSWDPQTVGTDYGYAADSSGTSYVLAARLEDPTNKALEQDLDGIQPSGGTNTINPIDCGTAGSDNIYCVGL